MMVCDGDEWLLLGDLLASCGFCEREWRAVKGVSHGRLWPPKLAETVSVVNDRSLSGCSDSNGIPRWLCCVGTVRREFSRRLAGSMFEEREVKKRRRGIILAKKLHEQKD